MPETTDSTTGGVSRRGLLLINLGTPDAPQTRPVRRYLRQFLSDPRVLDIPALKRAFVLNAFILPFRPRSSAEAYRTIWTERGSPLLFHGLDLADKLRSRLPGVQVELGMRYQNPSIESALETLRAASVDRIVALPLFPQYSSSAWGSAVEELFSAASRHWNMPAIQVIPPFYDHPAFLDAVAAVAHPVLESVRADRVLMSFHGLPERHVIKSDESARCGDHCLASPDCCDRIVPVNRNCYRAQCIHTAREIARRLGLPQDRWETTFQSRLGREPWLQPYTDVRVRELAAGGVRRIAVLCPAFVADCLETLEEIAIRAREDFIDHGGEELALVPSLNSEDVWADAIVRILEGETALRTAPG